MGVSGTYWGGDLCEERLQATSPSPFPSPMLCSLKVNVSAVGTRVHVCLGLCVGVLVHLTQMRPGCVCVHTCVGCACVGACPDLVCVACEGLGPWP